MRALDKLEKKVFWVFSAMLIIWGLFSFIYYDPLWQLLEIMLPIQLILLFVRRCPTWLYISVAVVWVGYGIYSIYQLVTYTHSVEDYFLELGLRWIINLSLIAISALLVIIKLWYNRAITAIIFGLELIYIAAWCGSRAVHEMDIIPLLLKRGIYDLLTILYLLGTLIAYSLMLVVVFRSCKCSCGYIYRQKAKFCGGCGKAFELK